MKYVLLLPDGAADEPLPELGGRTPLQAARMPTLHALAARGRVGLARTAPASLYPGSDVCTMSLLGYDPLLHYTGRAPVEAAARGIHLDAGQVVLRCNFVTIDAERMVDFTAGHIRTDEAAALIASLNDQLDLGMRLHAGVSYRHLAVDTQGRRWDMQATPPHDLVGSPVHWPTGPHAALAHQASLAAARILSDHPVNAARRARGDRPATHIWLWGQGPATVLPSFQDRWGLRGACVCEVDVMAGLAALAGWPVLPVDGLTGYVDTNFAGMGAAAVAALDEFDLVCVHIEAPDEAGHQGDAAAKTRSLEQIDEHIAGPLWSALDRHGSGRMLVAPDHPTPCAVRTHTRTPPPFLLVGDGIVSNGAAAFTEEAAVATGLLVDPATQLMGMLLGERGHPPPVERVHALTG